MGELPHGSSPAVKYEMERLEKASRNEWSYRVVKLANQLEALLIDDRQTEKASTPINVNVSSFNNEEEMPSLVHAVKHLLFMGTKFNDHEAETDSATPRPCETATSVAADPNEAFSFNRLQDVHFIERKVDEAFSIVRANLNTCTELREAFESWAEARKHSDIASDNCGKVIDCYSKLTDAMFSDINLQLDRIEIVPQPNAPRLQELQRLAHRRGRGRRRNDAYWAELNRGREEDPFDGRECVFSDAQSKVRTPAMANLDTQLKVPGGLIMSSRYAKELGRQADISQDFDDPCLRSISGHLTPVTGILRDVVFRLKGTSVTFKRDFFICDAIDDMADVMFGASFIKDQFKLLFERLKGCFSTFATWFSTKKETREEKGNESVSNANRRSRRMKGRWHDCRRKLRS